MERVLVLAAHPDDESLGLGGTIIKHVKKGDTVTVLILTDGVGARHEYKAQQKQAARNACKILGVTKVMFGDFDDQRLDGYPLIEVVQRIEKLIEGYNPTIIYTHHGGDVNQDHRVVFNATLIIARPTPSNSVRELICYETPSSTEWAPKLSKMMFYPNLFIDISSELEQKLEALEAYQSTHQSEIPEFPHPRSIKAIRLLAQKNGLDVGISAAESFMQIRKISSLGF